MKIFISFLLALFTLSAFARINRVTPNSVFEGERVRVRGSKISSKKNPLNVSFVDGAGNAFNAAIEIKRSKTGFSFLAPSVARTRTLNIKVSGGNVPVAEAQTLPIIIFNSPDASTTDPSAPEGELEVNNLAAGSVIFNNTNLSGNTQGELLWGGKPLANDQGESLATRLIMDEISLEVANGTLTWNSHPIITDQGETFAASLGTLDGNGAFLTLGGNGNLGLQANSDFTVIETSTQGGTLTLPPSGNVISVLRAEFSVADDTGVTGERNLRNAILPENARVTRVWYEVLSTFSSATDASSIGISIPVDDVSGLLTPIVISDPSNPWDQGAHVGTQSGLLTNISNKTTAKRNVQLRILGEALNTGSAVIFIEYMVLP